MTRQYDEREKEQVGSALDTVGRTPLVRITRITAHLNPDVRIFAKIEKGNPGGSVKDRAALRMIIDAAADGRLTRDKTIIDSSSGNTGIAYAMIGAVMGYDVKIVIPENAGIERKKIIACFGAELIFSSPFDGADGAIRLAKEIVNKEPDRYFQPDQYNNPSNPKAHFLTTGPEILRQTKGAVTHFVACVGTGGTIMGVGKALREHNPAVKILSVHPDDAMHGIEGMKYLEEGAIVPAVFDKGFPDVRLTVDTEAAFHMTRRLSQEEGLFVGHSSGAALSCALKAAEKLEQAVIVVMFPDGGDRYLSREL
ncbi:MAG: cysteine synthase family protein [Nitrospirota bacterium]|nr:cysteine synthase family protein [Nitrospirota bacterium]